MPEIPDAAETLFLEGALRLLQPRSGYRFSLDAPILADFIPCRAGDTLLDIGSGCGVIPLILHRKKAFRHVWAVEIQPGLAEMARRNVGANGAEGRVTVVEGDVRTLESPPLPDRVDAVFSNPPYRAVGRGRTNPHPGKAIARHEFTLALPELFRAAGRFLGETGVFHLIHLAERQAEILTVAGAAGFAPSVHRPVFSRAGDPAPTLVLLSFRKGGGVSAPECRPPLAIYDAPGRYAPEFLGMITP